MVERADTSSRAMAIQKLADIQNNLLHVVIARSVASAKRRGRDQQFREKIAP